MIVDASVLAAAHLEHEPAHARARTWYARAVRSELAAPTIVLAEVSAAIARATGDGSLAEQAIANLLRSPIEFVLVDRELALRAAVIGREQRLRGCDAIYVALAVQLGRPLVTLDAEQLTRGAGVAVLLRPGEAAPDVAGLLTPLEPADD